METKKSHLFTENLAKKRIDKNPSVIHLNSSLKYLNVITVCTKSLKCILAKKIDKQVLMYIGDIRRNKIFPIVFDSVEVYESNKTSSSFKATIYDDITRFVLIDDELEEALIVNKAPIIKEDAVDLPPGESIVRDRGVLWYYNGEGSEVPISFDGGTTLGYGFKEWDKDVFQIENNIFGKFYSRDSFSTLRFANALTGELASVNLESQVWSDMKSRLLGGVALLGYDENSYKQYCYVGKDLLEFNYTGSIDDAIEPLLNGFLVKKTNLLVSDMGLLSSKIRFNTNLAVKNSVIYNLTGIK
jgi:hypothetical protein